MWVESVASRRTRAHPPLGPGDRSIPESRSFLKLFSEALSALAFNFLGLLAGIVFATFVGLFSTTSWGLRAYPCVLTVRGMIGGMVCGRLSSGLWLGTIRPRLLGNTEEFKTIYEVALVISAFSSLMMSLIIWSYGLPHGADVRAALEITSTMTSTMAFSFLITMPIPALAAFMAFKHGVNPDVVTYPIGSTSSDILVTCCYAGSLALSSLGLSGLLLRGALGLVFLIAGISVFLLHRRDTSFRRTLKEGLLASFIAISISGLTGVLLADIAESIGLWPGLCMVYPALMSTMGDVGSVVGSTATTKLFRGELRPGPRAVVEHMREILATLAASTLIFMAYAFLSMPYPPPKGLEPFSLVAALMATNIMAFWAVVLLSLSAGIATYRFGLNPDNFVIPIESSATDAITTLALLFSLSLFVGPIA